MDVSSIHRSMFAVLASVIAVGLILTGCTSQNDGVSLERLSTKQKGIVFMGAELQNLNCYVQAIKVGKKNGDHFIPTGQIFPSLPKELPAGEHYVNHIACKVRQQARAYGLGRMKSGFTSGIALHKYAKFYVEPGKVTDVGVLSLNVQENRVTGAEVREHNPEEKAYKLKRAPRLYSKAETRLMTTVPIESSEVWSNSW